VPEGSLVGSAPGNSLLTRITQTDPIYVSFSFDSDDVTEIRALSGDNAANLRLWARVVANGTQRDGVVNFTDSSIDQATGTVRGRALFTNADGVLTPGQFVQITLGGVRLRRTHCSEGRHRSGRDRVICLPGRPRTCAPR
jgi:membrane fusion protein (multidrug efflux system)